MNIGSLKHLVTLAHATPEDSTEVFVPATMYASIRPSFPGAFDEQKVTHIVEARYHPQITFNTRLVHENRNLYVRGIQDLDEKHEWLVLLCEEVKTP